MTTPTPNKPNKPNKKLFYLDLVGGLDMIDDFCKTHEGTDGFYLESCELFKKLYEWRKHIKNDTNFNRNMETLSRCRNPMTSPTRRRLKKLTCNKCGRKVINLVAHQKRDICIEIEKEKQFSNQFKTDDSVIITTIAKEIIADFWRKYKTRSGAGS